MGEKAFLRENLICYISETKGRKNFKYGEVSLQMGQFFLRENGAKNFRLECHFNANLSRRVNKN